MKHLLRVLFFSFLSLSLFAEDPDIERFKQLMQQEIVKAEERVAQMQKRATDKSYVPASIDKVAFRNAITMLEVKKILVDNFKDSPLLSSPKVRTTLYATLQKDFISESDLANLQNIVESERSRLSK